MKPISVLLLLCIPLIASGQFTEDFSEENFSNNPVWMGDTAYWVVAGGKLQSRFPGRDDAGTFFFHLSTHSSSVQNTSWEFWVQLHFNTSSRNYVEVYLTSDQEDPRCGIEPCKMTHGYFVRIGGTHDQISLYRRDSLHDGLLIRGRNGITSHGNNILKIKVTCNNGHQWSLYDDTNGSGKNYFREGTAIDSTYLQSKFFSIVVYQNGKSDSGKHFFDDIKVQPFIPDTTPPFIKEIFPANSHHVSLLFSEPVDAASAGNTLNYASDGGLIMPDSATPDRKNAALIHLYFEKEIQQAKTYHLQVMHVSDLAGNEIDTTVSFVYYVPHQYDVIMDELFPDPTPSQGLPEYEFTEIKNVSSYPVNLTGWKFCDPARCAVFPPAMLLPGNLLILCDKRHEAAFTAYGNVAGLSHFPSLNNSGDALTLYDKKGNVIHSVNYNKDWYQNDAKDNGGWSLEMKDTRFPCLGSRNWAASTDPAGGTPGTKNSVDSLLSEMPFLSLRFVSVTDSQNIVAHFNMGMDSAAASIPGKYAVSNVFIDSAIAGGPLFNTVHLHLKVPLQKRKFYTLTIHALSGCGTIPAGLDNEAGFGWPEPADSLDIVINEILFNPRPNGHDFVELYNPSPKIIDISTLQFANRNSSGAVASVKTISTETHYLFPHEYLAFTEDKQNILEQYVCKNPDNIFQVNALPQYPNTSGAVILLDTAGNIIDEVDYNEAAQSAILHNDEGVSLERIDVSGESNDPANWHSASSVAGYATPGYLNSQSATADTLSQAFTVSPEIFSPDGDGIDDIAFIRYRLPAGFTGKIIVFDAEGHPVRNLITNSLLGTHGEIRWDGRNDQYKIMPAGVYIIYVQIFNLKGTVRQFKLPVVLAKRR